MDLDFLEIRNGKICNASGEQVQLRGTCVGGWMNMENFINGYPGSELGVRLAVADVLGTGKAEYFFDRMLDKMLGEEDVKFLKACQPYYAKLFKGMSEDRLDQVMDSFALKNCRINAGLIDVVKKHMK